MEDKEREIIVLQARVKALEEQKDGAYAERNKLVSLLSKMLPASIEQHVMKEGEDWDDDWRAVVFVNLPTGQATWHIHCTEEWMFQHLDSVGNKWDGHTTEEKYKRVDDCTLDNFAYFGPIMPGNYNQCSRTAKYQSEGGRLDD